MTIWLHWREYKREEMSDRFLEKRQSRLARLRINRYLANSHENIDGTRPGLEVGGQIHDVAVILIRNAGA